ncbi:MAG: hypothetical protein AAGA91_06945 [Pseudomonadota bacterium]
MDRSQKKAEEKRAFVRASLGWLAALAVTLGLYAWSWQLVL